MKWLKRSWYFVLLIILTCLTYYKIFGYAFWRDDWGFFWGVAHNDNMLFTYLFHPSTIGEFILLNWLFGSHVLWWNVFGVLLKILASCAVYRFIRGLTRSDATGHIAGLLFATTPVGLESVGWSGAHVVLLDAIFFSYAMSYFIEHQEEKSKRSLTYCVLFTSLSLISDPVRALPLIPMFFVYKILFHPFASPKIVKRIIVLLIVFSILFFGLFIAVNFNMAVDTRIIQAILRHGWDGMFYVRKTVLAFSVLFSSLGNMFIGWIVRTKEDVGFSDPSVIGFIGGCIPFLVLLYIWKERIKKTAKKILHQNVFLFFLIWTYLFYMPNWIFNIIMTPGFTNRYLVVSSVGYVGLMAYVISFIRRNFWYRMLCIGLVCVQITVTFVINQNNDMFRSDYLFRRLTNRMDAEVPQIPKQYVFLITTKDPLYQKGFFMSKQVPFVIRRNIGTREQFPLFAQNLDEVLSYICGRVKINNAVLRNVPIVEPVQIADIYAWNITERGMIQSIHQEIRQRTEENIQNKACRPN